MTKDRKIDDLHFEMQVDKDIRVFIECLQDWYDKKTSEDETSNKELSTKASMNPSALSRLINGRNSNPNLRTLIKVFRAMNLRLRPEIEELNSIKTCSRNFTASQVYDDAAWQTEIYFTIQTSAASLKATQLNKGGHICVGQKEKRRWSDHSLPETSLKGPIHSHA